LAAVRATDRKEEGGELRFPAFFFVYSDSTALGLLDWLIMPELFCALLFALGAAKDRVTELTQRLETRYRAAKTLEATFLERYSENGEIVRVESGEAYFRKPGKMRWEYQEPEKSLFLVDGKSAWFYVPADHTVTRMPAKQSTDLRTPLALLAGGMKVSRICARVEATDAIKPQREGQTVLHCSLHGDGQKAPEVGVDQGGTEEIFFEVEDASGELQRIIARQPGGLEVEFHFEKWLMDPPLPEALFHFEVPAGVAIVNGELPDKRPAGN
jgi:outer membrane lipoprotein carrier protein